MDLFSKTEIIVMAAILAFILLVIIILTILDILDERKSRKNNIIENNEEKKDEVKVEEVKFTDKTDVVVIENDVKIEPVQAVDASAESVEVTSVSVTDVEPLIIEDNNSEVEIEEIEVLDFDEPIIEMKEEITNNEVIVEKVEEKVVQVGEVSYEEFMPSYEENILVVEDEQQRAKEELRKIEEQLQQQDNFENTITNFEIEQEENAIISYDELLKVSDRLYDQNQDVQYDDGDEPITIDEVIKRFSSNEMVFENTADYDKLNRAVEGNDKNLIESYKSE